MKSSKNTNSNKKSRREQDDEFSAAIALAEAARTKAAKARAKAAEAEAKAAEALDEAERATEEAIRKGEALQARIKAEKADADACAPDANRHEYPIYSGTRGLLVKALGMLGSNHVGERAAAALMAEKLRVKLDKTWDELIVREHDDDDDERSGKKLVMANVIPLWITYTPEELADLDVRNLNRWLKDALTRAGFKRVMLGSIDFSWEADRGIYQPHWHIAMFTSDPEKLLQRLKPIFPIQERGDRPVVISKTYSLKFLAYKNKAIKLPALLRNNRRGLPYLLLALDRTEPLELMVLFGVRVSAQDGGLEFKKIQRR
jgi:hypothetical protein